MDNKYSFDVKIPMSRCDFRYRLGVAQAADIFMDAATDHGDMLGVGFEKMAERDLFWMAARCRYRFHRMPDCLENVTVTTWPGKIRYAVCNRFYTMTSGGELLVDFNRAFWRSVALNLEFQFRMVLQHGSCDSHVLCLCRCDDRLVERIEDSREVRLYLFLYNDRFLLAVFQCLLQVFNLSLQLVNLCILCAEVVDLCVEDINLALVAWLHNLEVVCLVRCLELVVQTYVQLHV